MSQLPRDGVQLVVEGANKFISELNKADAAWGKTASGFDKSAQATQKVNRGFDQTTSSAGAMGGGLLAAAGSIGAVVTGLGVLAKGAGKVIGVLREIGDALFGLAVRSSELEGISTQFAILNQNVEGGSKAMLAALQAASGGMLSARDLMSRFNSMASLTSQEIAQDLPEALDLLTKASFSTGKSIEVLFEKLQRGVARASPLLLDDLEIQVGLAEATQFATGMFGKEADALNEVEKKAAIYAFTLEKLREAYGAMPDTTLTLVAGVARLQANFKNIGDTLGTFLVPAFTTIVDAVNRVVEAFAAAISEGGRLEPLLITLGAWLSLAADAFAKFADFVVSSISGVSLEVSDNVAQMAEDALRWGVELIAAFAEGIVHAATTVLTKAMEFIGSILSSWLLGASPPKVAPGIRQWGIGLMQSFLEGMTEADFGILGDIQGPLKKILEGPEFANVSKVLAGALAGGDRAGFLETTAKAAGVFGDAVRKLAELNFELADSVMAVEDAEKALAQSREQVTDSQAEVNRLTAQYNELLREGADRQTLQAQLGLINAAEDGLQVARDQVNAQEDAIQAAKERQKQLKTEKGLQKSVVDQLLGVNDALKVQDKETEKKKEGKVTPIQAEAATFAPVGLGGRISTAIDKMKADIKAKFADIFSPLTTAFGEMKKDLDAVGEKWDEFRGIVSKSWDELKKRFPVLQRIENWLTITPGQIAEQGGAWVVFQKGVVKVWDKLRERFPILQRIGNWAEVTKQKVEEQGGAWAVFQEIVSTAWGKLKTEYPILQKIETWARGLPKELEEIKKWFDEELPPAIEKMTGVLWKNEDSLYNAWKELLSEIETNFWPFMRDTLWPKLLEFTSLVLTPLLTGLLNVIGAMEDWKKGLGELWKVWREGPDALTGSGGAFFKDIGETLEKYWDALIGNSPAPLAVGIKSVNDELATLANFRLPELNLTSPSMQGAFASPTPMMGMMSSPSVTVNAGGNTINSGMDEAAFDARIQRSLRRVLR